MERPRRDIAAFEAHVADWIGPALAAPEKYRRQAKRHRDNPSPGVPRLGSGGDRSLDALANSIARFAIVAPGREGRRRKHRGGTCDMIIVDPDGNRLRFGNPV